MSPPGKPSLTRISSATLTELTGASAAGIELVIVPTASGPCVYEGRCPHQGTLLSEGSLAGGVLTCRSHGWRFDAASGKRCDEEGGGLRPVPSVVQGDGLFIDASPAVAIATQAVRKVNDLPAPRGLPLLGNALQLELSRFHHILEGWADQLGSMYRFRVGPKTMVVVTDPVLIETVMRARPAVYRRIAALAPIAVEIGMNGVFTAEGDSWRAQRKLATEALSHRHFNSFFKTMQRSAGMLNQRWERTRGEPTDVMADLMRFTVDVTTGLAFGVEMNTIERDDEVIQKHLSHIFPALGRRVTAPWPYWRYFRLPADRRLDKALTEVHRILEGLITQARQQLDAKPEAERVPSNFLEAMIVARDDADRPFADDIIFGNVMTMMLAGEDTTASSAAWAVHELCERPELIAQAREEIRPLVNQDGVLGSFAEATTMPVLDSISYETLRFRSVAPFLIFEPNEDTVLGELLLPKGTPVYCLTRYPAVRSAQFGDASVFRPERWREKHLPQTGGAYTPFGAGPRLCPGRSLALLEMRVLLSSLLHNFDLTREGAPGAVTEHWAFTMVPGNLRVRLTPRSRALMS